MLAVQRTPLTTTPPSSRNPEQGEKIVGDVIVDAHLTGCSPAGDDPGFGCAVVTKALGLTGSWWLPRGGLRPAARVVSPAPGLRGLAGAVRGFHHTATFVSALRAWLLSMPVGCDQRS
jgi:hypothetical protein